jgi:hypothetical protein
MDVRLSAYSAPSFCQTGRKIIVPYSVLMHLCARISRMMSGASTIPISGINISDFEWAQYSMQLSNTMKAPNSNTFAITFDASEVASNTYCFGLASLFLETYNDWPNSLRRDLAGANQGPWQPSCDPLGGNNIEGYLIDQRWRWQDTISPLRDRKGRVGYRGYTNSTGLGLLDFWNGAKIWISNLYLQSTPTSL